MIHPHRNAGSKAIVVVCLCFACGGSTDRLEQAPRGREAPADIEELAGKILITGSEPVVFVTLRIEGESSVTLLGPLLPELRRLSGATVRVRGVRKAAPPFGGFEATSYEITSIDGARPFVGVLQERNSELAIVGAESIRLSGVSAALRRQAGAKIWVVGHRTDSGLQVQSYGVIREPGLR